MLTLGQKILAFGALLCIFGISFYFSPLFSMLLVPITIVTGIMVKKL